MPLKRVGIAVGLAALALAGSAAAAAPPRAELRGLTCRRAPEASGRQISVAAVMRPVSGTVRMALKFELDRRVSGALRPVPGRQLGQWISPGNPTLGQNAADVWILRENVVNLAAPAAYRFQVRFRWTGAGSRVLAHAVRFSPVCLQPAPRADLVARSLVIRRLGNGEERYDAVIHNGGGTPSGPFTVELDPPGGPAQSASSPSLSAGATEHRAFDGPACPAGSTATVVVDPAAQVDDANRANDMLTVACPATA